MNETGIPFDNHDGRIQYYELLLARDLENLPSIALPEGYKFVFYQPGDRDAWIEIETSAKEFISHAQGMPVWNLYYGKKEETLPKRMVFVENAQGIKVATATAYYDIKGRDKSGAGWLHWVAVRREYQGKGLSKPLITYVLSVMRELGYTHAKIPTQTTTWLACKIYLDLGFRPLAQNAVHSKKGWEIIKALTNHTSLSDVQAASVEDIIMDWVWLHRKNEKESELISEITLGTYPQTHMEEKEPIEWIVLKKEKNRCLCVSKYLLDCRQYHDVLEKVTWSKCTLRKWLNEEFLSTAFTSKERERILLSDIKNPMEDTQDYLFLLSCHEAETFFEQGNALYEEQGTATTNYARLRGAWFVDESEEKEYLNHGTWWLRYYDLDEEAKYEYNSAVNFDGYIERGAEDVTGTDCCVRPAFWLKTD